MSGKLLILLGTAKGVFVLRGDRARRHFEIEGPFCETLPVNHVIGDPVSGALYAGGGNGWRGPSIWRSDDGGRNWMIIEQSFGPGLAEGGPRAIWSLAIQDGRLLAGGDQAILFASDDGGRGFAPLGGLRDHPSREHWHGGGAGLILHSIVPHPGDPRQFWVAISAAGVFHTMDGGQSFTPRNRGTRADFMPEDQRYPEYGQCVHGLAMAAGNPGRLYQQNHCGMYRSDDGGQNWTSIEKGLPSSFGFPVVAHPRDSDTLFLVPLNGDMAGRFVPDAAAAVWCSRDAGENWQAMRQGLPQAHCYFCVLRQAMAVDPLEPAGLYFGSSSGSLYASFDEGESFTALATHLPVIQSVETFLVD
ncbi:MAG: exo-alpha-sialidase [Geminicoccaceae bacterium]|nr:exo-alpha-sialidase [Geminicoccaceae bacterium]